MSRGRLPRTIHGKCEKAPFLGEDCRVGKSRDSAEARGDRGRGGGEDGSRWEQELQGNLKAWDPGRGPGDV